MSKLERMKTENTAFQLKEKSKLPRGEGCDKFPLGIGNYIFKALHILKASPSTPHQEA